MWFIVIYLIVMLYEILLKWKYSMHCAVCCIFKNVVSFNIPNKLPIGRQIK